MKKLIIIWLLFTSCDYKPTPEFYINGEPYYTKSTCIESHSEYRYDYHYGFNAMRGKFEYHMGGHSETVCDVTVIDTIKIITKTQ